MKMLWLLFLFSFGIFCVVFSVVFFFDLTLFGINELMYNDSPFQIKNVFMIISFSALLSIFSMIFFCMFINKNKTHNNNIIENYKKYLKSEALTKENFEKDLRILISKKTFSLIDNPVKMDELQRLIKNDQLENYQSLAAYLFKRQEKLIKRKNKEKRKTRELENFSLKIIET